MHAERLVVAAALVLAACSTHPVALLTRPEGDGGWSDAERQAELARRAAAGAVPLGGATTPAPLPPGPLTLPEALALARGGNRRIAQAERTVDAAAARVGEARAALLPDLTGSASYTRYTDAQRVGVAIPSGLLPPGSTPGFTIREQQVGALDTTLRLPLDLTGEFTKSLESAQAGYRGERARLWATTLDEEVGAIRSYFDLLAAERLREVTRQRLASERQQLANAQERFDAGRLTKNELLVVQVAVRDAEQELVGRELAIDRARWSLNQAVGRAVDAPTVVADVAGRPALPDVGGALRDAFAHNPVVVSLLEERQRLDAARAALARGWLPRVSAGGAIDWNSQVIIEPRTVGSGFVGLQWDLSTNGQRLAQLAEATSDLERTKLALEAQLRALELAVRSTQRAAAERLSALDAAEAGVAQAEENLRIRRQQFDAGRATSEDVLDAEALLTAQRATRATALYEAHTRRAELQQLIGLPLDAVAVGTR